MSETTPTSPFASDAVHHVFAFAPYALTPISQSDPESLRTSKYALAPDPPTPSMSSQALLFLLASASSQFVLAERYAFEVMPLPVAPFDRGLDWSRSCVPGSFFATCPLHKSSSLIVPTSLDWIVDAMAGYR